MSGLCDNRAPLHTNEARCGVVTRCVRVDGLFRVVLVAVAAYAIRAGGFRRRRGYRRLHHPRQRATAQLLDRTPGTVFTAGDNAYPSGTAANCVIVTTRHGAGISGGRGHRLAITSTRSAGAAPYFQYFGERAGPPGLGYYSYSLGSLARALVEQRGRRMDAGRRRWSWLRGELASNRSHVRARIFPQAALQLRLSRRTGQMREMWRVLYEFGVDVVVAGHDHNYERFAPQDPSADSIPPAASGNSSSEPEAPRCARSARRGRTARFTVRHGDSSCSRSRSHSTAGSSCRPSLAVSGCRCGAVSLTRAQVRECASAQVRRCDAA